MLINGRRDLRDLTDMFIIGQRLNAAGNTSLAESIKANQDSLIQREAISQEQAGADALDVHVATLRPDRMKLMADAVDQIRSVSRLPLSIDDADPDVVSAGLKRAGRNSLINSPLDVSGNLDRISDLALEFMDTQLLIVPLQEKKVPETRDGFFKTTTAILSRLEDRGISRKRVVIDAVLFCLKQAREKVLDTLERIKMLKQEFGVRSVIGLSNLSYQLNNRELIHAAFLSLAKKAGLDCVICDPLEKKVMEIAKGKNNDTIQNRDFLKLAETVLT